MRFFYRGAFFIRGEFKIIEAHMEGSKIKWVRRISMMRKLKKVNVPNTMQHQSQPNEYRIINKKKIRRFLLAFLFIFFSTLYVQYILTKQQEMIQKKRVTVEKQQKQLVSLKKDSKYLETKVENLTDNEEEILQFARKEYHFSKPDETIFILPE